MAGEAKVRTNEEIADRFEEVARLLAVQGANPFRARAYREAAATLRSLPEPAGDLLRTRGLEGLEELPAVGESIARSIRDLLHLGRLPLLDRLRGESDPLLLLATVPGVGPGLAGRFHHELGIDTLEELETAAHDGRLAALSGVGPKRLQGIRDSLSQRLARVRAPGQARPGEEPGVREILEVDLEYRKKAAAGRLRRIAPRRFNPEGRAWLPVLHARRGERHYTVLFSNTPRAHQMGKTRDWVVLYYEGEGREGQCTVITAERGPLAGRRIVRGREAECAEHYGPEAPGGAGPSLADAPPRARSRRPAR